MTSDKPIESGDPLASLFMTKSGTNTTNVQVNTELLNDGYVTIEARMWLTIGLHNAVMTSSKPALIKVLLGCKTLKPEAAKISGSPYFGSMTNTSM
jgi:hypothetical protein